MAGITSVAPAVLKKSRRVSCAADCQSILIRLRLFIPRIPYTKLVISLVHIGAVVASDLARPVVILLETASAITADDLTLPTIIAGRKTRFPLEKSREMTRIRVANIHGDIDDALFGLA